jgi:hypothetical protein
MWHIHTAHFDKRACGSYKAGRGRLPLFSELPLSEPWPFFLQGHPEFMKNRGVAAIEVGFPLVPRF